MKKTMILASTLLWATTLSAQEDVHWGYSGKGAPEHWASLTADNTACLGVNQSPINLTGFIEAELAPIEFNYQAGGNEVINNGHTIQINYQPGSSIKFDNQTFNLLQVHFHAPSENHINGQSYPLEAHFVHANKEGNLAVIAVMYDSGEPKKELKVETDGFRDKVVVAVESPQDKMLADVWKVMPQKAGGKHTFDQNINVANLLPKQRDYYRFNGSLTTPPCTEGVRWLVMKNVVTVSESTIATFASVLTEPNNRPIQPVNARPVLQ